MRVVAELTSLKKNKEYGFHVYQYTDPVDNDIGEILNPKRKPHGCPGVSAEYRLGDLGNIKANALGVAMYDSKMTGATIADIVGRSVVIHAHKDDCISQPIGNSGEFLAEGVISLGNPNEIGTKLPKDNEQEGKIAAKATSPGTGNAVMASKSSEGAPAPTNAGRGSEKPAIIAASKQRIQPARTAGGIFNTEGNGREEQQVSSPSIVNAGSNVESPNSQGQRPGNVPSSPPNKPAPLAKIDKANDEQHRARGDNNGHKEVRLLHRTARY